MASSLEESLKEKNKFFTEHYKKDVAKYKELLAKGKEAEIPTVWAAVGGAEFKPDRLFNIFSNKVLVSNDIECPPDDSIKVLSTIPLAHKDIEERLNAEQSMSNIMEKLRKKMSLPVIITDHIGANSEQVFSQCIKNYEQSGEYLPMKPETKITRR